MIFNRFRAANVASLAPDDFMFRSPQHAEERETEIVQAKKQHMISALKALAVAQGGRTPRRRKRARR